MSPELDSLLCTRYPKIFKDRHADMRSTAMCWGFECGDGWFTLIDTLCSQIQWHLDKNAEPGTPQVVAQQVKEKFGGLRFYTWGGDQTTRAFQQFAEAMSIRTCEVCGNPGERRGGGWIQTLCDEHNTEDAA